jgi:hypothetical protein
MTVAGLVGDQGNQGGTGGAGDQGGQNKPPEGQQNGGQQNGGGSGDPWYKGADEATATYIKNKAWDSPLKTVESYKSLETVFGAEKAGRDILVLPDAKTAKPEDWNPVYDKLGRPKDATGYTWSDKSDKNIIETAAPVFHKIGLNPQQATELETWYNSTIEAQSKIADEKFAVDSTNELTKLKTEMGSAYDDRVLLAKQATKAAGLNIDELTGIERIIGSGKLMKMLMGFGDLMREGRSPDEGGARQEQGGGSYTMTPDQARAKIAELKLDSDFMAKYLSPNNGVRKLAIDRMEALQKVIAGTQ